MEIGCRFGRDEEFDCKDKMKKSAMQKPASGNLDIIGKLIFRQRVIAENEFFCLHCIKYGDIFARET